MVLVGNKIDLCTNEEVGEYEGKDLAKEIGAIFLTISAKKSNGIEELFSKIGEQYMNLKPTLNLHTPEAENIFNNEKGKNGNKNESVQENNEVKNSTINLEKENKHLKDEINFLKNRNAELQKEVDILKVSNSELLNKLNNMNSNQLQDSQIKSVYNVSDELISLMKKLEMKENEIESLKKGNDFIPIIFFSNDKEIHYSTICKKTDKFFIIENKLYDAYPQYRELENLFFVNGKKINRFKTISDNNINYSDIITVIVLDEK